MLLSDEGRTSDGSMAERRSAYYERLALRLEKRQEYSRADLAYAQAIRWLTIHASGATSGAEGRRYSADIEVLRQSIRERQSARVTTPPSSPDAPQDDEPPPEEAGDVPEAAEEWSLKAALQTSLLALGCGALCVLVLHQARHLAQPGLPWHMLWWSALFGWSGLMCLTLSLPPRLRRSALGVLLGAALLLTNPVFTGLGLGTSAWFQGHALDQALERDGVQLSSTVIKVSSSIYPEATRFILIDTPQEVSYRYEVDGVRYRGTAVHRRNEIGTMAFMARPETPYLSLRYLPSDPWVHQLEGNAFVEPRLRVFTVFFAVVFFFATLARLSSRRP